MVTSFFRRLAKSAPIAFGSQSKSGFSTSRFSAGAIVALSGGFSYYYLTSGNNLVYLDQAKEETGPKTALNPDKWLEFKLQDTARVSHNTQLFRYSLGVLLFALIILFGFGIVTFFEFSIIR